MEEKFEEELLSLVSWAKEWSITVRVDMCGDDSCSRPDKSYAMNKAGRVHVVLLEHDDITVFNSVLETAKKLVDKQIALDNWEKQSPNMFTRLRAKLK